VRAAVMKKKTCIIKVMETQNVLTQKRAVLVEDVQIVTNEKL
jgi:hypothetical protein